MKKHNVLLILGNGFDLDLGLKTSYKDFVESKIFQEELEKYEERDCIFYPSRISDRKGYSSLFDLLKSQLEINNWIDVENELLLLATRRNNGVTLERSTDREKEDFGFLTKALCRYLEGLNYADIEETSSAYLFVKYLPKLTRNISILNFNYTDLYKLKPLQAIQHLSLDYVHGMMENGSAILGFQDDVEIDESYSYMIKSFNPCFRSHNVNRKLNDADEIIFFGHSLGETDYHYFKRFFQIQSDPDRIKESKTIRIITKSYDSQRTILEQLRRMNDKRTDLLYDLNDFEVLRTDNQHSNIETYYESLRSRCLRSLVQPSAHYF